jgi:hypothetical protein
VPTIVTRTSAGSLTYTTWPRPLSQLHLHKGDEMQALMMFQEALEIYRRSFALDHPIVASVGGLSTHYHVGLALTIHRCLDSP